jgi:hypothetical protein
MILKRSRFQQEIADRQAITDCIHLYSRALDRCDGELLGSIFWDDALIHADRYSGNLGGFLEVAIPNLKNFFDHMAHLIGNVVIRIDGDHAVAESYFFGYQVFAAASGKGDIAISGRYLDRFTLRNEEWRIMERTVVVDWYRDYDDTAPWNPGPMGNQVRQGQKAPNDLSYGLFAAMGGSGSGAGH